MGEPQITDMARLVQGDPLAARLASVTRERDALREALREIMFAGCRHVWDDECARCHTFEPLKSVARRALSPLPMTSMSQSKIAQSSNLTVRRQEQESREAFDQW